MKAYITFDEDTDSYDLSTEPPPVWAGVDSDCAVEVELPSDTIQKYLSIQVQWQNTQESLDHVFTLRTGGVTVGTD